MNILNITSYGDLFPNDLEKTKIKYKELAKKWHPDVPTGNEEVFSHITALYNQAMSDLSNGRYKSSNYLELKTTNKTIQIKYLTSYEFDLGVVYICTNHIVYVFNKDTDKFFNNAVTMINSINYPDNNVKDMIERFMPKIHSTYQTNDGNNVLVLKTEKTIYPLQYVLKYFKGQIEARHVAWMITRMSNIECFLQTINIVHNGITLDNIFVEPSTHSIYLFGGWWYSGFKSKKMIGVNAETFNIMPIHIKTTKLYGVETDLESIKYIARTLLGQSNPRLIRERKDIPTEFLQFITDGAGDDAIKEYQKWDKLLDASYGTRKFIKMEINNVYN